MTSSLIIVEQIDPPSNEPFRILETFICSEGYRARVLGERFATLERAQGEVEALKAALTKTLAALPTDTAPADPFAAEDACLACHEAPAEGAGEREGLIMALNIVTDPGIITGLRTAEEARSWIERSLQSALRARSSAPEAREGEAVGVVYSLKADLNTAELPDGTLLYTHPAAPSADKLRIAVEALEPFANLGVSSGPDDEPCHYAYRITRGAIRNARQALAALKA